MCGIHSRVSYYPCGRQAGQRPMQRTPNHKTCLEFMCILGGRARMYLTTSTYGMHLQKQLPLLHHISEDKNSSSVQKLVCVHSQCFSHKASALHKKPPASSIRRNLPTCSTAALQHTFTEPLQNSAFFF